MGKKKENLKKKDVSSDNILSGIHRGNIEVIIQHILGGGKGFEDTKEAVGKVSRETLILYYKENPRSLYYDWCDYHHRISHWKKDLTGENQEL